MKSSNNGIIARFPRSYVFPLYRQTAFSTSRTWGSKGAIQLNMRKLITVLLLSFPLMIGPHLQGLAQEQRPHHLTSAVQARATELNLWSQIQKTGGTQAALQRYLDVLTAADLVVDARLRAQNRKEATNSDYDIGFAATCVFVPNKPQTPALLSISPKIRDRVNGIYFSPSKREAFLKALRASFLQARKDEIFRKMGQIKDVTMWDDEIFNTGF